ncbi:MAG: GspE/PulE family protein [Acidimicrobiia bacterium]
MAFPSDASIVGMRRSPELGAPQLRVQSADVLVVAPMDGRQPLSARPKLGEILTESGRIAPDDLQRVLSKQRNGQRLGDALLEEGLIDPIDLLRALAKQFGLDFVDLDTISPDLSLVAQVPEAFARRHRAIPIVDEGDRIVVAMANPADVFALDDIRVILRRDVRPVMADPSLIMEIIERVGRGDSQVQEAMRRAMADSGGGEDSVVRAVAAERTGGADDAPIVQFVDLLIAKAVQDRASDIHIEPTGAGLRVRFRIDGVLVEAVHPPKNLQSGILSRIKVMADIDIGERRIPQDGRASMEVGGRTIDLRVATVPTVYGEAIVMRILHRGANRVGMDDLGFLPRQLEVFKTLYKRSWGALFVTGPTGSGKTTTLYGTLQELNQPDRNIITIEDPVEYRMDGIKQVQVNNKAGLTFAAALRSFLRADPDIILVGEIRDKETATIAVEASLTGHLVLSTLHTNDAASTPLRLLEMGVEPFLVTSAVHGVLAQRLARKLCERCREPVVMSAVDAEALHVPADLRDSMGGFHHFRSVGCSQCAGTGYRGRFAIHELLPVTEEISSLVLQRVSSEHIRRTAVEQGMITLHEDGMRKVAMGLTAPEELVRVIG